jgi:hypothetical protein
VIIDAMGCQKEMAQVISREEYGFGFSLNRESGNASPGDSAFVFG